MAAAPILQIVRNILLAAPAVTGLVATRVYPGHAPVGAALPHVIVRPTATSESYALDGPTGLEVSNVVVTSLARSYEDADALARAAINRLNFYEGVSEGRTVRVLRTAVDGTDWVPALSAARRLIEFRFFIGAPA